MQTETCANRISEHWENRRSDFLKLIESEDYEELDQYMLEVARVEAHPTPSPEGLHLQHAPFDKLLISWGGPSEEIRFYEDGSAVFVLLDWGDKAEISIRASLEDETIAVFLKDYFFESVDF
jgi:hypothetical protein